MNPDRHDQLSHYLSLYVVDRTGFVCHDLSDDSKTHLVAQLKTEELELVEVMKTERQDYIFVKEEPQEVEDEKIKLKGFDIVKTESQESEVVKTNPQEIEMLKAEPQEFEVVKAEPREIDIVEMSLLDWTGVDTETRNKLVVMETEHEELRVESSVPYVEGTDQPALLESGREGCEGNMIMKEEEKILPNMMNSGEMFSSDLVAVTCTEQRFSVSDSMDHNQVHDQINPYSTAVGNSYYEPEYCGCGEDSSHMKHATVPLKFSQTCDMKKHVENVHFQKQIFRCLFCEQTFAQNGNKKRHIETVHLKKKQFKCSHCEKRFTESGSLKRHIKTVHLKKKYFSCSLCEKSFSESSHIRRHIDTVHLKKKEYKCSECKKRFTESGSLKRHIKTVHLKKTKKSCFLCEKSFSESSHIKRHIDTVHLKKKEYKCSECEKRFTERGSMNRHIDSIHLKKKQFECSYCEYKSSRKGHIKSHIETIHLKKKILSVSTL